MNIHSEEYILELDKALATMFPTKAAAHPKREWPKYRIPRPRTQCGHTWHINGVEVYAFWTYYPTQPDEWKIEDVFINGKFVEADHVDYWDGIFGIGDLILAHHNKYRIVGDYEAPETDR